MFQNDLEVTSFFHNSHYFQCTVIKSSGEFHVCGSLAFRMHHVSLRVLKSGSENLCSQNAHNKQSAGNFKAPPRRIGSTRDHCPKNGHQSLKPPKDDPPHVHVVYQ
jgi:hypothetical protein